MEKSTNLGSVHISGCSTLSVSSRHPKNFCRISSDPRIGWSLFFMFFFGGEEGDLVKKGGGLVSN